MKKSIFFMVIAALAVLAPASSAWEWWHTPYAEDHMPIDMWAETGGTHDCSGSTEFSAFIRAGTTWNVVPNNYFRFAKGGIMGGGEAKDGRFNLSFATSGFQPGVLAYTSIKSYGSHGECDIVFNDNINWYCGTGTPGWNKYDIETVCLHEMGHLIGFAHSSVYQAVMYAYYSNVRRNLHSDDIAGIQAKYPD